MIERFLIQAGIECGSVKNFNNVVIDGMNIGKTDRWYFRTPVKVSSDGFKSATLDCAFPFAAIPDDIDEASALSRIELIRKGYEKDLLFFLRKLGFICPPDQQAFTIIPFWAELGGVKIHILNGLLTLKYRDNFFNIT